VRWKRIESAYLVSIHLRFYCTVIFELQTGTEVAVQLDRDAFACLVRGDV
jgi:hypothetical protein